MSIFDRVSKGTVNKIYQKKFNKMNQDSTFTSLTTKWQIKAIALFMLLFSATAIQAQSFSTGNINYDVTSPTTVAVAFQNNATTGNVTIPAQVTYNGASYSVTSIVDYAFFSCTSLTSVTIPNSVTSIGGYAFHQCFALTSITIPNSVTSIGEYTFHSCYSLTSVTIPNTLTSLNTGIFGTCSSLASVTIPNSVTSIAPDAFNRCSSLTSITIPNSVTSIGHAAFAVCSSLASVTIPNSVASIDYLAFQDCISLTSFTCNITSPLVINADVFQGVTQGAVSLKVPVGSVAAYQSAPVWQNFMVSGFISIPTSKVKANQCGTTLATLDANINADYVAGYQAYRFEVSNGATVNTVDVNKYNFSLTQTPDITYGTTYGVRVAVKIGSIWGDYGASCNVTTPALASNTVLTTNVHPNFCGVTLAALDTKIPAKPVQNAQGYRFEITTGGVTIVYDSATYIFKLTQAGVVVDYGMTYTIRVAALVNGVYGDYGASCTVATPTLATNNIPTTQIHPTFCGTTLAAVDTKIPAAPVLNASGYRFEITSGGVTNVYDSAVYNFKLSQTGATVLYSTTYAIRVAALINGVYGNYGASCTVTTPAAPIQYTTIPDPVFEARLISLGLDSGAIDHKVITANIASVTDLNVADSTISDLTGIRDFASLQNLNCFNSNITSLNVSGLTNLQNINSYQDYFLTTVILTGCTALNHINFGGCPLTTISFAGLTAMSYVEMNSFNISEIDLSSCHNLTYIYLVASSLNKINLSGLASMSNLQLNVGQCENITCIQVDDVATANQLSTSNPQNWWEQAQWSKPAGASYSTNCGFNQITKLSNTNNSFAVKAYPNPYDTAFNLNLETPSKENVTVTVYNMMGALVESHQVNPMEVANLQLGSNFSTGIYNVIVSQANEMQVLRLIRK